MARQARGEYLNPGEVQIVHALQRCVRRAFLCGADPRSGESFEHRRQWIRERLEFLASVFAIDCLTYTVLSNHLHIVLRSRPDVAAEWSANEVARRWLRLFPARRNQDDQPAEPTEAELKLICGNAEKLEQIRTRLSDISWWMRCTAENIARQANREEGCSGRFWEGRYRAQLILDETSLLACAMYVDLNPIRAALAQTPEESHYTGAKDRIDDLKQRQTADQNPPTHTWERNGSRQQSGWLSPIEIAASADAAGADASDCGRRASQKGFLPISLTKYLELLDWTGRQLRSGKRGAIPASLSPILDRLGLDEANWCTLVQKFGRLFKRAAGSPQALAAEAVRRGQRWLQAPAAALFTTAKH